MVITIAIAWSSFTDFAQVGFTVKTKDGKSVTVKADRCGDAGGGGNSIAVVSVGEEKFRSYLAGAGLGRSLFDR